MRINSKWLAGIIVVILFGGIALSAIPGWWTTESSKIPKSYVSGDFTGSYNPADIRGSYTFGEVSQLFSIPLADLQEAFLLMDIDPSLVKLKDLETKFAAAAADGMEIGTGSVQLFVAYYLNLPFVVDEEFLPEPGVNLLKQKGNLTPDQITYLDNHSVSLGGSEGDSEVVIQSEIAPSVEPNQETLAVAAETHTESTIGTVKGNTTFRELLEWGVPESKISEILGLPMPNPLFTVKDFCLENGLEFGTIKVELQTEIP